MLGHTLPDRRIHAAIDEESRNLVALRFVSGFRCCGLVGAVLDAEAAHALGPSHRDLANRRAAHRCSPYPYTPLCNDISGASQFPYTLGCKQIIGLRDGGRST